MTVSGFYWNHVGIGLCGAACRAGARRRRRPAITPLPPPSPSTDGAVAAVDNQCTQQLDAYKLEHADDQYN